MGVFDVPKAVYKAKQAQKRMSKIQAAGKYGVVGILLNGLNNVEEVEIDAEALKEHFVEMEIAVTDEQIEKLAKRLEEQTKKAFEAARKSLEKELINSTSLDDLKGMLG